MDNRTLPIPAKPASPKRHAFTLVELLVVIAIISILAAMLLPTLETAMETARTIVCQNKMKQLGHGFLLFADDHDEYVPREAWRDPNADSYSECWAHTLPQYLDGAAYADSRAETYNPRPGWGGVPKPIDPGRLKFHCPLYGEAPAQTSTWVAPTWNNVHYPRKHPYAPVYSWACSQNNAPQYAGVMSYNSNHVFDFYGVTLNNDRKWQLPAPWAKIGSMKSATMMLCEPWSYGDQLYFNPKHGDRTPVAFADGHVKLLLRAEAPSYPGDYMNLGNYDKTRTDFWGLYLLKYYANPSDASNWNMPARYKPN